MRNMNISQGLLESDVRSYLKVLVDTESEVDEGIKYFDLISCERDLVGSLNGNYNGISRRGNSFKSEVIDIADGILREEGWQVNDFGGYYKEVD
jgi:hypothetical protein